MIADGKSARGESQNGQHIESVRVLERRWRVVKGKIVADGIGGNAIQRDDGTGDP